MKFFAVFAAVCAVASASQGWTLTQLSQAVASPATNAAIKPVLEQALNHVMDHIFNEDSFSSSVAITTSAGVSGQYNLAELESLLTPETHPVFIPYIEEAFAKLISAMFAGEPITTVPLMIPALELYYMSLEEIDNALSSPATNPALMPYLEHSLNEYVAAVHSGLQLEAVVVVVPAGLGAIGGVAAAPALVAPAPAMPGPVVPGAVVPSPVVPTPEAPSSSPLVQIIVNVRQAEDLDVSPAPVRPSPAPVRPDPTQEIPEGIFLPSPLPVPVRPDPIQEIPEGIFLPSPLPVPVRPDPIQEIPEGIFLPSPLPVPGAVNPIDAIAIPVEELSPPTPGAAGTMPVPIRSRN